MPLSHNNRTASSVAEEVVRSAGGLILERFREAIGSNAKTAIEVSRKAVNDLVTDVDLAAERIAIKILEGEFPDFGVLAEESGSRDGNEFTWILDPLDGSRNFAYGIPQFAVSLALVKGRECLLGATYDPCRDELFMARRGEGAYLNGQPLRVSSVGTMAEAILALDIGPVDYRGKWILEMAHNLWPGVQAVRIFGSAALGLAYVASGRVHLYAHHQVSPWDITAGILMIREAGGVITDAQGEDASFENGVIVAGSRQGHQLFLEATDGTAWRTLR